MILSHVGKNTTEIGNFYGSILVLVLDHGHGTGRPDHGVVRSNAGRCQTADESRPA